MDSRKKNNNIHRFSYQEDELLKKLVQQHGKKWKKIVESFPGRNRRRIRERYLNYLDPRLNLSCFTSEEDEKLLFYVKIYGTRWNRFVKHFPGRTDIHLKNRNATLNNRKCLNAKKQIDSNFTYNTDNDIDFWPDFFEDFDDHFSYQN
jgi:hypothetical protein